MKMNKYLFFTSIVAAFFLPACQKEVPGGIALPMQVAPTLAETKGCLTTSDLTDFYLQIVSDDATYSYFEHASKDGSGAWTTPSKLFWKNETSPVSYCAAHFGTYAFTADDFKNGVLLELPVDQRTQELMNTVDLLTMSAASKKYEDTTGGILPVTLAHGLAKVTFTLTLGPKFYENHYTRGENPVKDFTVSGTNACFNFKPQTGVVTATADTPANILPLAGTFTRATAEAQNATATYEAILVPQSLAAGALKVTFRVGAYDYGWSNDAAVTLEPGKTYDLTVSVTTAPPDPYNGHEFVDLGLPSGLKWATCNVGATTPEDPGDHFAWGDTVKKDGYTWPTYTWCNGSGFDLTKYCIDSFFGSNGFKDNMTTLETEDDAASYNWGSPWRMSTRADYDELLATKDNTADYTWTWCDGNNTKYAGTDVRGWQIVRNSTGATLFLPAAGYRSGTNLGNVGSYGYYWSSSLNTEAPNCAWFLCFKSSSVYVDDAGRQFGQSVRPVCD